MDVRLRSVTSGNRVLTPRDLVQHLGSTESWWIRQRPRMVKTRRDHRGRSWARGRRCSAGASRAARSELGAVVEIEGFEPERAGVSLRCRWASPRPELGSARGRSSPGSRCSELAPSRCSTMERTRLFLGLQRSGPNPVQIAVI
jgi:hypothetical protein